MSVVKFNTQGAGTPKAEGSNAGAWIIGGIITLGIAWAAYEFWWKPKQEEKKAAEANAEKK